MKTTCAICNKEFNIRPAKVKVANYCSHTCYWESKKKQVEVNCLYCSAELSRKVGVVEAQGENHFCNIECRSLYRQGENHPNWADYPKRDCVVCGNEIRHRLARFETAKYCSRKCKSDAMAGENSRWWKGGVWQYPRNFGLKTKKEIKSRDGWKCRVCDKAPSNPKSLHVHHIDKNKQNNNYNNLITLCAKCHREIHTNKIDLKIHTNYELRRTYVN